MFTFVNIFKLIAAVCVIATLLPKNCYTQTTTVRPYKFGFTIDEQQHRYEKRDEKGIVMGEFGFITADGIYHVTVYATDEEGKFRILAMKNYPYESPPKTIDMVVQPKPKITIPTVTTKTPIRGFQNGQAACSGCFLPAKKNLAGLESSKNSNKPTKTGIRPLSKTFSVTPTGQLPSSFNTITGIDRNAASTIADSFEIAKKATKTFKQNTHSNTKDLNTNIQKIISSSSNLNPQTTAVYKSQKILNELTPQTNVNTFNAQKYTNIFTPNTNLKLAQIIAKSTVQKSNPSVPNIINPVLQPPGSTFSQASEVVKPIVATAAIPLPVLPNTKNTGSSVNAQTPSVVKSINKYETPNTHPVTSGKSIPSVSSNAVDTGDLYRFKYLLDYNGHTETGSRNGNKQGNFYSIGEDNIERTIEYVANEFGFQPRIRWRKLDANEIKSKENKLKDYEFVWFKQQ